MYVKNTQPTSASPKHTEMWALLYATPLLAKKSLCMPGITTGWLGCEALGVEAQQWGRLVICEQRALLGYTLARHCVCLSMFVCMHVCPFLVHSLRLQSYLIIGLSLTRHYRFL